MLTSVGRSGRLAAVVAVPALLGAAVAASRGSGPALPARLSSDLARTLADTLLYAGAAWVILSLLVVAWALWPDGSARVAMPERPPPARRLLGAAVAALVLIVIFYSRRAPLARFGNPENQVAAGLPAGGRIQAAAAAPGPGFDWAALAIVAGLLLLLAFAAITVLRRRSKPIRKRAQAELARALEESLDDLRAEPDLRRAVIAAYRRMERVLERHGLSRRAPEAPFEYLARALAGVDLGATQARRLTELFEWAKFSPHAVDAAMREEAVAALEAVRTDLRANPEPAVVA